MHAYLYIYNYEDGRHTVRNKGTFLSCILDLILGDGSFSKGTVKRMTSITKPTIFITR